MSKRSCSWCDECKTSEYEAICGKENLGVEQYVMQDTIPLWCPEVKSLAEEMDRKKPTLEEFKAMVEDYKKNTPWYKRLRDNLEIWWITRSINKEVRNEKKLH